MRGEIISKHYLNGQWVEQDKLAISPLDLAVLRGFGIFDFLTATNGQPFHLDRHLDRYEASAKRLGLASPVSRAELERIISEGIGRNHQHQDLFIRLVLTGGESLDFITPGKPNFMVMFHPAQRPSPELYSKGVKVITYPHVREQAETKSLNYAAAVTAKQQAKTADAFEALYLSRQTNELYEGTGSNLFGVRDGVLITPRDHILKGIMRQTILELAAIEDIPVMEQPIFYDDVSFFDELFITSSIVRILPVRQVDGLKVRKIIGPMTQKLTQAFEAHLLVKS